MQINVPVLDRGNGHGGY